MADFAGEASLAGGALNGLSDFFTGSPRISEARAALDERNKNPSLLVSVCPAQPIRKTVQNFHIPLTYAVLRRRRREPVSSNALVRRLLHLHPALHQLRSSGFGEVPHPSSNLRVRQGTFGITSPDVPNEVLVVDQPLVPDFSQGIGDFDRRPLARWRLPALQILGLERDLDLGAQNGR